MFRALIVKTMIPFTPFLLFTAAQKIVRQKCRVWLTRLISSYIFKKKGSFIIERNCDINSNKISNLLFDAIMLRTNCLSRAKSIRYTSWCGIIVDSDEVIELISGIYLTRASRYQNDNRHIMIEIFSYSKDNAELYKYLVELAGLQYSNSIFPLNVNQQRCKYEHGYNISRRASNDIVEIACMEETFTELDLTNSIT